MPDFEDLRLIDLLQKFEKNIEDIYSTRSLSRFKQAGADLQNVYNFYVTAQNGYKAQEELFKSLYSSFNYAAVIVNNALKNGGLQREDNELLGECMEIMLKCCQKIKAELEK